MFWTKVKVWLHGAYLAAGAAFSAAVIQTIQSGVLPTTGQLKTDGIMALCVGISYLLKVAFLGSSSDSNPPAPSTGGNVASLLLVFIVAGLLSSCAALGAVKWSGSYQNGNYCLCANVDSVSFSKASSTQLVKSISGQKLNLTKPMIDSLIKALEVLKTK